MVDDDIREGLRAGDLDHAFRALRERYGRAIYRQCYSVLQHRDLADDAMQDAFAKMYRERRRLAGADSIKAYALQIAKNTARDTLRKAGRRSALDREHQDGAPEVAVMPGPPDIEPAETAALHDCLDAVEPATREALFLHHRDELPWRDIATAVGVDVDTIRMRVARVLKALKECLQHKGIEP